jgi:hypothetical protein
MTSARKDALLRAVLADYREAARDAANVCDYHDLATAHGYASRALVVTAMLVGLIAATDEMAERMGTEDGSKLLASDIADSLESLDCNGW